MNGDSILTAGREAISAARAQNLGVFVSPITAWEIATLTARNRITLTLSSEAWFDAFLELPGVRLAVMPPSVLIASRTLPGFPPKDPADRVIAATARALGYVIATRNGELTGYAAAGHVEIVAC